MHLQLVVVYYPAGCRLPTAGFKY